MDSADGKKKTIFYPSFKFEKKTKAFNKYIGFFVSLISMFIVVIGIGMLYAFMSSFLNLADDTHLIVYIFLPVIIFIALSYQGYQFLQSLLYTYQFKEDKIIKGKIQDVDKITETDLAIDAAATAGMIANIGNSSAFLASHLTSRLNRIIRLIKLNSNPEFVEKYFDTELYKKKEYINPKLMKETKYSLIYNCDNKNKLLIPKIYEGICHSPNSKESSFIGRIIKKSVLVFVSILIIAIIDLSVGYSKNNEYLNNISSSRSVIEQQLYNYGFTLKKNNENMYTFSKNIGNGEQTSQIKYWFDKNGNITEVDIQLYYNSSSKNVDNELRTIITTLNDEFDSRDVDNFINLVKQNINGKYQYGKLSSKKYSFIISRSNGYVDIH